MKLKKSIAAILTIIMIMTSGTAAFANPNNGAAGSGTSVESQVSDTQNDQSADDKSKNDAVSEDGSISSDSAASDVDFNYGKKEGNSDKEKTADGTSNSAIDGESEDANALDTLDAEKYTDAGIAEGYYTIHTAVDTAYVLDIYGGYYASGTNVQLYKANGSGAQVFKVTPIGDGLYTIINAKSGCALDVYGGHTTDGTNVWQYKANGSDAQKWKIVKDSEGNVKIFTLLGDGSLCLDLAGGIATNTRNIQIYTDNGSKAQNFIFKESSFDTSVSSGTYVIRTAINGDRCLDILGGSSADFANLQIYQYNGSNAQKFVLTDVGSGQYMISCVASGKALDVYGGGTKDGTNVAQYTSNGTAAQKWILESAGDGKYFIKNVNSGKYLDVASAADKNGANVQQYTLNKSNAQKWIFELVDGSRNFPDALYTIANAGSTSNVLDIYGGSLDNTGNVQIYTSNNTNAQKFKLEYQGNGYYRILNQKSGKVLDVAGATAKDGTNVWQYTWNGSKAQLWKIVNTGDGNGSYFIQSMLGNYVLDITNGQIKAGTNVQIYTLNKSAAQKFVFKPTVAVKEKAKGKVVEINPGHAAKANTGREPIGPGATTTKQKFTSGTQGVVTGLAEYELNLQVSLKLRDILVARGYTVYMSRTTNDSTMSNAERARKATADGADIYVQIHANSVDSSSVSGVLNYAPASNNPYLSKAVIANSQKLATLLTKYQCAKTGQRARDNIYANDMTGINWSTVPTSIVEMGFMSNASEDRFMANSANQKLIATGIADGIDAYFNS